MLSYQTAGPGEPLQRTENDTPVPDGREVLLKTVACGVCHSDIHLHETFFDLGDGQKLSVGGPGMILGHEIFGEVVAVGPNADGSAVGDRRVVYPWIGCGECPACLRGDEQLCTPGQALGISQPGGFSDHVMVPDGKYLFDKGDVPDSLAATYSCSGLTAYSALKKVGHLADGDHLVIIGAGGVGMMAIQIAQSVRDFKPIVVDIDDKKLAEARKIGVEHVFNSSDPAVADEIVKLTGGGALEAIDFVGAASSFNFGIETLRKGGRIIVVGLFGGALNMPLPLIPMTARVIEGAYVGSLSEMVELMELVREGKVAPIQIDERPMAQVNEALNDLKEGKINGRIVLTN